MSEHLIKLSDICFLKSFQDVIIINKKFLLTVVFKLIFHAKLYQKIYTYPGRFHIFQVLDKYQTMELSEINLQNSQKSQNKMEKKSINNILISQ